MAPGRVQHQNDLVCGSMILEVAAELSHGVLHNCMIVPGGIFAPKTEAFWDVWSNFMEKLDRELALVSNEDLEEIWLSRFPCCVVSVEVKTSWTPRGLSVVHNGSRWRSRPC